MLPRYVLQELNEYDIALLYRVKHSGAVGICADCCVLEEKSWKIQLNIFRKAVEAGPHGTANYRHVRETTFWQSNMYVQHELTKISYL